MDSNHGKIAKRRGLRSCVIRKFYPSRHWVEGKEGEADGKNKDNKKTPRRISENDEKGHSSFRV